MGLAVLLVEDDPGFADFLTRYLEKEGHNVDHAPSGEQGVELFTSDSPDLVLMDLMLPGIDGLEALEQMKKVDESAAVIVMTAHGSIASAVEAMRLGAMDFLTKPIDLEALGLKMARVRHLLGLRSDLGYLLDRERKGGGFEDFIGSCLEMQAVYERIREVAKTDNTTVLVTGESGTGKELVARAIHSLSSRSDRPLMQIDCTSIPLALLESELFGHERGAFTGAEQRKKGLLELADGGTLLLDEIGDMDLTLQSKFLRVLQERLFRRVGGTRDLRFDVRVIAATNQDLEELCEQGRFRSELLYRLKVFQIELPPLRDRGEDVLEIADTFVRQYAASFRKPVKGLAAEAQRALTEYAFPGNVRELKNIVEQAMILVRGEELTRDLLAIGRPGHDRQPARREEPGRGEPGRGEPGRGEPGGKALSLEELGDKPLQAAEQELIRQALRKSGGNKKRAAEFLGISRFALQRKLEKLALEMLGEGDEEDGDRDD